MKRPFYHLVFLVFLLVGFQSCEDHDDVALSQDLQINDFIWRGLNATYLWQEEVPNLGDNRFNDYSVYQNF